MDWDLDSQLKIAVLSGRIDLKLTAWVRIFWKKLKKSWKKNITKWEGKTWEKDLNGLDNHGTIELAVTPDLFTLPNPKPLPVAASSTTTLPYLDNYLNGLSAKYPVETISTPEQLSYFITDILEGQPWEGDGDSLCNWIIIE